MHLGGSEGRSYIMMEEIGFGAEQIIFKHKSAIVGCLVILNQFIFELQRLERDFAVGRCSFQKCFPRGGYMAQGAELYFGGVAVRYVEI